MALPPWTVEFLRRSLADVAKRASEPETLQRIKTQAAELLNELPETAARGLDRVMRTAESNKESVRRWTRKHTALSIPMLNATGVMFHPEGTGVPVSDETISAGVEVLRGDTIGGEAMQERLDRRLARLVSADRGIAITESFLATLSWLTMLLPEHELVLHRHHSVRLPSGESLARAIPMVTEIGASDSVDEKDFFDVEDSKPLGIIQADVGSVACKPIALPRRQHPSIQIAVLPLATFATIDVARISSPIPSALGMLDAGFDLVVLSGAGLAGGPNCGVIVGKSELIETIRSCHTWEMVGANAALGPASMTMMLVTLETAVATIDALPISSLLLTSEENLKGRAERLALRISAHELIASNQVTDAAARLTAAGRWTLPSRQVRLRHRELSSSDWAMKLREQIPSVWVGVDGEEVVIDLRWVSPADDAKIADALVA